MLNIVFLHPDLGIGGAERLVVDAALYLKQHGHQVQFITSHHDPGHCFTETKDGTLKVTVVGDWIPRQIFGKCYALCAYVRMIYAAFYLTFFSGLSHDVVFCDQVAACIPVLRLGRAKTIFYCHHPDLLLTDKTGSLKRLYRAPLDWFEEVTTGMADVVLVNSNYTASVFRNTFQRLHHIHTKVLYPSLNTIFFDKRIEETLDTVLGRETSGKFVFLSINRYERKKNIALAIKGLAQLKNLICESSWENVLLVVAGGYDHRVEENVEYYKDLEALKEELNIEDRVILLKSPSDLHKLVLLNKCSVVLYTPENEHFGIVPLEAMYVGKPVIAANSGGPLETVISGETGYLCDSNPESFAKKMKVFIDGAKDGILDKFGKLGRKRVIEHFSFEAFGNNLDSIVNELVNDSSKKDD